MNQPCPKCGKELRHLHNCAYGIPETHMGGSERYECPACGYVILAEEGKTLGLKFVLDVEK